MAGSLPLGIPIRPDSPPARFPPSLPFWREKNPTKSGQNGITLRTGEEIEKKKRLFPPAHEREEEKGQFGPKQIKLSLFSLLPPLFQFLSAPIPFP